MLELKNLTKSYDGLSVLKALNLHIQRAQTTVLIGPSGCGKSTIIRLIAGLIATDAGAVLFDGEALCPDNLLRIRRRLGYVIQEGGLFPHLTAQQNVSLMAHHLGWPRLSIETRIEELVELTRFPGEALNRYPAELSGGQRQRVGLMRALMLDPDVLLLDEPLGALDPIVRFDLQEELKKIFATLSKTVVWVTHDLSEAAFFGDHIVLLQDGRIAQQGPMTDLLTSPQSPFVERFVRAQRSHLTALEGSAR